MKHVFKNILQKIFRIVEFTSSRDVDKAFEKMDGYQHRGRKMQLVEEKRKYVHTMFQMGNISKDSEILQKCQFSYRSPSRSRSRSPHESRSRSGSQEPEHEKSARYTVNFVIFYNSTWIQLFFSPNEGVQEIGENENEDGSPAEVQDEEVEDEWI